ncbi:unnamed protein product [Cuscuta campestris]|uniref:Uncharacterized protein n=1 Tax=Cuscuta campestris TaxID=132261 RepID=A0A484M195_9ASTE|nr:unnamed protein product [Cuscuta campestris]
MCILCALHLSNRKVGPDAADRFSEGSPSKAAQLKEKVKEEEQKARELNTVIMRQIDELTKLSRAACGCREPSAEGGEHLANGREEQVRNPILENLRGLNLNLPRASKNPITPEMIVVNQEPIVGDNHIERIISSHSKELVELAIEGKSSMKEQEVKFPITDSLIVGFHGKRQPKNEGAGDVVDKSSIVTTAADLESREEIDTLRGFEGVIEC